jgi:hypothetical protein
MLSADYGRLPPRLVVQSSKNTSTGGRTRASFFAIGPLVA